MRVSQTLAHLDALADSEGAESMLDGLGHHVELLGDDWGRRPSSGLAEADKANEAGGDLVA